MDRRSFLKTTTAAAAASTATVGAVQAASAPAAPAVVTARSELQVAVEPGLGDAAHALARDIEIASAGRIVIHLADGPGDAERIRGGHCDGALGVLPEICSAPELALFSGLPGTLSVSPEFLLAWLEAAGGSMFLDEVAADYGLAAMVAGHSGAGTGLWASGEVDGLAAFAAAQTLSIGFGPAIAARIGAAFGAVSPGSSSPLQLEEMALAPMEAFLALPSERRQIWYRDALHAQGFATALVLSRTAWDGMPASDQLLLTTLTRAAAHADIARGRVGDRLVAPAVMNSLPLRRERLTADIVLALQHTATDVVRQAMARERPIGQAFQAYGAYYQAIIGTPLPGSLSTPSAGV